MAMTCVVGFGSVCLAQDALMRTDAAGKELQPYRVKVNDREYNFAELLKLKPADTDGARVETVAPFLFIHPGTLNDLAQLNFIKQKIAEGKEPWASAFERMKKSRHGKQDYLTKMKQPPAVISSGFNGSQAVGAFKEMNDATAAYAQALLWYFTGERKYAENAAAILETYAKTVTSHEGANWYLLVAWSGSVFPVAADLLKATDPEWKNAPLVQKWFNDVYLPVLHNRVSHGNRELAVINAMAVIGVFNEDVGAFYEAMNHWVNYVPAYFYLKSDGPQPRMPDYWMPEVTPSDAFLNALDASTFPKDWTSWTQLAAENWNMGKRRGKFGDDITVMRKAAKEERDPAPAWKGAPGTYIDGYTAETARDLAHVDVSFVSTMNTAEIAWHQGIDLYTPEAKRLTAFMEAQAKLRFGEPPPDSVKEPLLALGTGPGAYEMAYDRFHNVMGMELPNTLRFLDVVIRPAKGARFYPLVRGEEGRDPANPRLWKFPEPFPSLFATVIGEEDGWLNSWQTLTHRDLHAK